MKFEKNIQTKKELLKGKSLEELRQLFLDNGQQSYRGEQVFKWMYGDLVDSFDEMLNLPKSLRLELSQNSEINTLKITDSEYSENTGTKKYIQSQ